MASKCMKLKKCILKLIPLQKKDNAGTSTDTCNGTEFLLHCQLMRIKGLVFVYNTFPSSFDMG